MPVSGLIVRTKPGVTDAVSRACADISCVEVTHIEDPALVVVTDGETEKEDRRAMEMLQALDGVVAVELIYHNFEDA